VETVKDALESLQAKYYDLVFCDLNLPDIDGVSLLETIKEIRTDLPVIVMTASDSLDNAVRAMRAGAWDYMVKQFDSEMRGRLELVIQRTAEQKLRQLREYELRAERNAFWASVCTAQDGLAILGAEGLVVFANEAFKSFCGTILPPDKTMGEGFPKSTNIIDLITQASPHVGQNMNQQLTEVKSDLLWSSELFVKASANQENDKDRYYELTLTSVKLDGFETKNIPDTELGAYRKHVLWVRDITRRKEQERFQRDLLSTTSHDLKGPLGAILTSAELLSDQELYKSIEPEEVVTRIASCARNCITIIDEFLSARRIQDGVMAVRAQWFSVSDLMEDVVLDYLPVAKAKNIALSAKPVSQDLLVYADKIGLMRVFGNLVSNAIKFTQSGGVVVLSSERVQNEVKISVADTGPGIDARERHQLFEKYSRLEKHHSVEGTGLGLYVTKNIIDAHGGKIEIKSEVGVGTTFIISLPDDLKEKQL
jgi:signal transduction histidine kinase